MRRLALSLCFLFSFSVGAAPVGIVQILKGEATFNKKPIKLGDRLSDKGELAVGDKSYIKIKLEDAEHTIVLGGNSRGSIDFSQKKDKVQFSLIKGITRWVSGKLEDKNSADAGVKTQNAVMGIRGTDFLVSYNELLGESEIVCFDGEVKFTNTSFISNARPVKASQWGGLGGRFGTRIAQPLDLPSPVMAHFNTLIPLE